MDQGTGESTQGQSSSFTDNFVVKLEPPWSDEEDPQDQPSAVCGTAHPLPDNTCGSLLSLNTDHACCQYCPALFMLSNSLQVHTETFHGETLHSDLLVDSRLQDSAGEEPKEKLNSQWSVKEEPQDEPSAVYSPVRPMSDNTSGSLLSLNTSHVCQRCSTAFVLFSSWELHMATFHGETPFDLFPLYSAYVCYGVGHHRGRETENAEDYYKKFVKGEKEKMDDSDSTDLDKKCRKHVCDVCNKAFTRSNSLKTHKLIHTDQKPFVCEVCSKAFTTASHLRTHRLIHTGQKPFVCDVCGKAFGRTNHLKTHKLIHTGDRPFACDVCSKAFNKSHHLKTHKLIHTRHKPFVCDMCSAAFSRASDLKTHKLIHTGHKTFFCDVCSKAFARASHLKSHKMIHTGRKSFVCDVCGKAFSRLNDFNRHKLIHTGCKSFACDVCSKAFYRADYLKTHMLIHAGHKSFICDVSSKDFTPANHLET